MFSKNNHQNSFLTKSSTKLQQDLINKCVKKIFNEKFNDLYKCEQMAVVADCKKYNEENFCRGFGNIGYENLIKSLSSDNLDLIKNSLITLENELKNTTKIPSAIGFGTVNKLSQILFKASSFAKDGIMENALKILNFIAKDFKGSQAIAKDEKLLKIILEYMRTQKDLEELCAEIFQSLTSVPHVANQLPTFISEEFQRHLQNSKNDKFFTALSNFIQNNPLNFVSVETIKILLENFNKTQALKCLSLILNSEEGTKLAHSIKLEENLVGILFNARDDETKVYTVMALRNCLINKEIFDDSSDFPWQHLLSKIVQMSKIKTNNLLQQSCFQLLRTMSDVDAVKNRMCKVYKKELREIACMTKEAKELKEDLLDWLDYRNYYLNDDNKYSKYFI
ncbi:hypothetical protein PVAND_009705 [Polypedilum vanderplanki]|uniref:Uncharacterized protein n=1 Tax=Polypedilum vanderplanki TaxID=319348 RepID=A0A9J6CDK2_POLVA|nr:hypothetical protein PVAND_009705 [Polypedilum vanderplanki]